MFLVSSLSWLCPIHWCQVLSPVWRCSWSSADRRCSNYIWVINKLIAYQDAYHMRGFTVMSSSVEASSSAKKQFFLSFPTQVHWAMKPPNHWFPYADYCGINNVRDSIPEEKKVTSSVILKSITNECLYDPPCIVIASCLRFINNDGILLSLIEASLVLYLNNRMQIDICPEDITS